MQTPLLFTPQTAQKNLTEVANKNESNINKTNADSGKTPFQMALDKQVRAKDGNSQPNQAAVAPMQNKKVHAANMTDKKVVSNQQAVQSELTNVQLDKQSAKQLAAGEEILLELTESKLDSVAAKMPAEVKDEIEIIPEDDINNVIALMAPISLEPANNNILANAKALLSVSKETPSNKQALVLNDSVIVDEGSDLVDNAVTSQSRKLDPVLEGTLALAKPHNSERNATADIHTKVDQVLNQSRWLSSVAGKAVSEDVNASKTMLSVAKDTLAKEMIVTSGIQPQVAQVQSQLAGQQVTQPLNSANIINVYPGKSGWDQAISQKVMLMVGAGEQSASLTLNPPDLGPLKVVIHVHNNQADTTFISDNDEVRRALESGLSHLRDKMNETGVQLGQTNISSSNHSQENFQHAAQNRALTQAQVKNKDNLLIESTVSGRTIIRSVNGLVDTFA